MLPGFEKEKKEIEWKQKFNSHRKLLSSLWSMTDSDLFTTDCDKILKAETLLPAFLFYCDNSYIHVHHT